MASWCVLALLKYMAESFVLPSPEWDERSEKMLEIFVPDWLAILTQSPIWTKDFVLLNISFDSISAHFSITSRANRNSGDKTPAGTPMLPAASFPLETRLRTHYFLASARDAVILDMAEVCRHV